MRAERKEAFAPRVRWIALPVAGPRILAALLDFVVVSALQVGLCQVFGVVHLGGVGFGMISGDGFPVTTGVSPTLALPWLFAIVVAYFVLFEGLLGATPGKMLCGLRVTTLDGQRPGVRAILLRNVLRLVDAFPAFYLVGGLMARYSFYEQRLGDRVAGTVVVSVDRGFAALRAQRGFRWRLALVALLAVLLVAGCAVFQYFGRSPLAIQSWAAANSTMWFDHATPGTPPLCGAMPSSPYPNTPPVVLTARISAYTLGTPKWAGTTITYPIHFELVSDAQGNSNGSQTDPVATAHLTGGPIYSGSLTLRWWGFLAGWGVVSGEVDC